MLKLSLTQLEVALRHSRQIQSLEAAKDRVVDSPVCIDLGGECALHDPPGRGAVLDFNVTAAMQLEQIASRLAASRKAMAGMGIELVA